MCYIRHKADGVGGSFVLRDYFQISSNDNIRIKTSIEGKDGDHQFEDTLNNNTVNMGVFMTIERIGGTNLIVDA
jgi:hypothetical protein